MRLPLLPLLILGWPLAEIASFVVVGREIGVLPTIGLIVATGIAGAILMRVQGFGVLAAIRSEAATGRDPGRHLAHGVMILLAGLLLLIPGFLSDIVGILLFLPPVRDAVWRLLKGRISVAMRFGGLGAGADRPAGGRGRTIDLEDEEFSRGGSDGAPENSPWRRIDRD